MPQKQELTQSSRIVWIDVLRLIAILMVICVHCSDPFNVSVEARSNPEFNFWGSIYGSFLRPCVPIFVMITGVLLLPINEGIGSFYKKRLLRIVIPFLIWSIIYNLFPWIAGCLGFPSTSLSEFFAYASPNASQSLEDALKNIVLIPFTFSVYTIPMWYLYMLIGLYLYMPFFSAWVEQATIRMKKAYLGIWFISLFLPYAYAFFSKDLFGLSAWNAFGTFYYFAGFNGYLLLGNYLSRDSNSESWKKSLGIYIPLFFIGYIATYWGFKVMTAAPTCSEQEMELFFLYCSPNVACMTIALFQIVSRIRINAPLLTRILSNITKCGLGIYLLHYFIVGLGYSVAEALAIPIPVRIPALAAMVFLACWGCVALSYKLSPRASKWIFG